MEEKNKEITKLENRQLQLKKEIKSIRIKSPKLIIAFILFTVLASTILVNKVYPYFGNAVNFIISSIVLLIVICLIYGYVNYSKIKKKEKEIQSINRKLYQLMKL